MLSGPLGVTVIISRSAADAADDDASADAASVASADASEADANAVAIADCLLPLLAESVSLIVTHLKSPMCLPAKACLVDHQL